jgi:zinc protease
LSRPVRLLRLAAAGLLLAGAAGAAAPLAHRERLANGLVLLVAERPGVPVVVVHALVRAGSILDPPGAGGLANLTAALLTRGSAARRATEIDAAIEAVGGRLGAEAGREAVTVSVAVLAKDLPLGLELLGEALRRPAFPEEELRREAGEVAAAIRQTDETPEALAERELARLLFPGHPYGAPVLGTVASVRALTREQVAAFHRAHYRPDAAIVVVAGEVTREEARRAVLRQLGDWPAPPGPPATVEPATPGPPGRSVQLSRPVTQATVVLGAPAVGHGHPDYFPLVVANYILGGGSVSRLYTRVREEAGLAYSVGSALSPSRHGPIVTVSLQTRADAVARAVGLVRDELARLARERVGPAELARARSYLTGSFPLRLDTTSKLADFLLAVEDRGLGLDYPARFRREVGRVGAADVQRAAARYLDPAHFSSVTVTAAP